MDKELGLAGIDLLISGKCNLKCKYCYIPKIRCMENVHNEVKTRIKEKECFKKVDEVCSRMYGVSFPGIEPSLSFKELKEEILWFVKRYGVKSVNVYTNFTIDVNDYVELAKGLQELGVKFEVQVSLDGVKEIMDRTRGKGVFDKVVSNLFEFVTMLNLQGIRNVELRFKPTLSIDDMEYMVDNVDKIKEHFGFFEKLFMDLEKVNRGRCVKIIKGAHPTIAVPGKYCKKDGEIFAKFLRKCWELGYDDAYSIRFRHLLRRCKEKPLDRSFTCSGGDSKFAFDTEKFHVCHRTFIYGFDNVINELKGSSEILNVSKVHVDILEMVREKFVVDNRDELLRVIYVMRGYHDFWRLRLSTTYAMIKHLADIGQVSERYVYDDEVAKWLSLFLHSSMSCPVENLLNTANVHVIPISLIRLFGNGAFEGIFDRVVRECLRKKIMR